MKTNDIIIYISAVGIFLAIGLTVYMATAKKEKYLFESSRGGDGIILAENPNIPKKSWCSNARMCVATQTDEILKQLNETFPTVQPSKPMRFETEDQDEISAISRELQIPNSLMIYKKIGLDTEKLPSMIQN